LFLLLPQLVQASIISEPTLQTPLVSHYSLEELSGVRADDHSANDLSDINTVLYGTGKILHAADFESSNSEYLSIADGSQSGLDLTSSMTLSAWVKLESSPGTGSYAVVSKYSSGNNRSYILNIGDTNKISYATVNGGVNYCEKSWSPSTGVWYMVSAVFDASADTVKMYVDGSQLGTTCTSQTATPADGSAEFRVGSAQDSGRYFDGLIDQVYVGASALDATAIALLYNTGLGQSYDTIETPPSACIFLNDFMSNAEAQTCVVNGATTTCEYSYASTTIPLDPVSVGALTFIFFLVFGVFIWLVKRFSE